MAETDTGDPSPVSIDELIRDIIAGRRAPTTTDSDRILHRMRESTFSLARRNIPAPLQDLMRQHGYVIPELGNDLIFHWAKHVLGDGQWSAETTPAQYFQDAVQAMAHTLARLYVQAGPSGRNAAVVVVPTLDVVPANRLGSSYGPYLLVVYSTVVDRIVSVYMTTNISLITSRSGTVWLRN